MRKRISGAHSQGSMTSSPRATARAGSALLVAALLAGSLATGCVTLAEHRKLERVVIDMQRGRGPQQGREGVADLGAELEALDGRLRELNGRVEELQRTASDALREARTARREAAARAPLATGGESGANTATPADEDQAPRPTSSAAGAGQRSLAAVAPVPAMAPDAGEREEGGSPDEIRAYQAGLAAWRNDEYAICIDRFRGFLQTYASSKRADDAAFWIGECHYRQGEFKQAVLRFDDVSRNYPTGNRAPDAVYRQGESLLKLGPAYYTAARKAFERVVQEYPDSARAEAARKQLEIRSPG